MYSGGMDSTVLLYDLVKQGHEVKTLSILYGQKHRCELDAAQRLSEGLRVEHKRVDISGLSDIFGESSLVSAGNDVPEGHYEEESMKQTVVPNRNMILLSLATAWAISSGADSVAYAAHSGDHAIYPDCREEFAATMNQAIELCDWKKISLYRPYVDMTKADIVKRGTELGVPFENTWSCYKGGRLHCGMCGTCIERREAFYLAGVTDSTVYMESAVSVAELVKRNWRTLG